MADEATRAHVGRIVFLPGRWLVQSLDSHARNVALLARAWRADLAFSGPTPNLALTSGRLVEAARIHDMGKPAHFRLAYDDGVQPPRWEYSFAGHRFDAAHPDAYVQALAEMHHEFSVDGVARAVARLRLAEVTRPVADHFPLDLYALEMCDQIEATVARAALGSSQPEERVFMDFQFRVRSPAEYEVDPFVFAETPMCLAVEYAELSPPRDAIQPVERGNGDSRRRALRELEQWLAKQLQEAPWKRKEVRLWPWML